MGAIFLCFIFTTLEEGSNLSQAALWSALRSAASVGNERDGEDARPWANCYPVCAILQTTKRLLSMYQGFVEIDSGRTVGIHCSENKREIPAHALFHDTERRSCYYNDLAEAAMWQSSHSISHCGTLYLKDSRSV